MDRYIAYILYPEIESKGFIFLDSDLVYPKKKAYELKELINSFEKGRTGINANFNEFYLNTYKEKLDFINEYLDVVHNQNFDGRSINKIRILLSKKIKKYFPEIKIEFNKYAYFENNIKLTVVNSLQDFIKFTESFIDYKNLDLYYRGHSNINWELIPSIFRNSGYINNENNMFRDITLRNPELFIDTNSTFEDLTIMQHYGLPTRLLDITKNPLVSLFFSCIEGNNEYPGEVIIFNPNKEIIKYSDSNNVSILSNLSKVNRDFDTENFMYDEFNKSNSGIELFNLIKNEKPYFTQSIDPYSLLNYYIVKPINNNERIKRQLGYFVIFGLSGDIYSPPDITDLILEEEYKKIKLVINENSKRRILKELDLIGINENTLFPEIENGTKFIKKKYEI